MVLFIRGGGSRLLLLFGCVWFVVCRSVLSMLRVMAHCLIMVCVVVCCLLFAGCWLLLAYRVLCDVCCLSLCAGV